MALDTRPVVWPTVSCTGHRIQHLNPRQQAWARHHLGRAAQWCRDRCGTTIGISGMAVGADLWWADAVVRAGLRLAAHVPCPQQTSEWTSEASIVEYERLLALADPDLSRMVAAEFSYQALNDRNLGMLDESAAVVALWIPGRGGGTTRALCEAARRRLPGIHLDPQAEQITFALPDPRPARPARVSPMSSPHHVQEALI